MKIGNLDISSFKVGGADCSIYLGGTKLYPTTPHDYSLDYLTFDIKTGGNIKWSGSTTANSLSYSVDSGTTWTSVNSADTITVSTGDKVMWKGTLVGTSKNGVGKFSGDSSVRYDVEGNAMSLLFGDNFIGEVNLSGKNYALRNLFSGNTNIINAENMILPATTLSTQCYNSLFINCASLVTIPELPATTLATNCYTNLFRGCTSLTTVPSDLLPATTLVTYCYQYMFYGCTSLTTAPLLPATELVQNCYRGLFGNCSSLNNITCLATFVTPLYCTYEWVYGVDASGTFTKAANMNDWGTGVDGIPSGWTVQDYNG